MNHGTSQPKNKWVQLPVRAIPFFVPGWLWLPMLQFGIPWIPRDINENVLALVLQIPMLLSTAVVIPWAKGWITARTIFMYLLLPNAIIFLIYVAMMPD